MWLRFLNAHAVLHCYCWCINAQRKNEMDKAQKFHVFCSLKIKPYIFLGLKTETSSAPFVSLINQVLSHITITEQRFFFIFNQI